MPTNKIRFDYEYNSFDNLLWKISYILINRRIIGKNIFHHILFIYTIFQRKSLQLAPQLIVSSCPWGFTWETLIDIGQIFKSTRWDLRFELLLVFKIPTSGKPSRTFEKLNYFPIKSFAASFVNCIWSQPKPFG